MLVKVTSFLLGLYSLHRRFLWGGVFCKCGVQKEEKIRDNPQGFFKGIIIYCIFYMCFILNRLIATYS